MNIKFEEAEFESYLFKIPSLFRKKIIQQYLALKEGVFRADFTHAYDVVGLSAGKMCESIFRFIELEVKGNYTPFGKSIKNFAGEAMKFESYPSQSSESVRILIPRAMVFLYTVRNKRNIGHIVDDIEANVVDARTVEKVSDWIICELIRIYNDVALEEAQEIINAIATKSLPSIWHVNGKKRILSTNITVKEQVLLFVYSEQSNSAFMDDLLSWTEYKNKSDFKSKVLVPLHQEKLVEFDGELGMVFISPKGIMHVEKKLLPS